VEVVKRQRGEYKTRRKLNKKKSKSRGEKEEGEEGAKRISANRRSEWRESESVEEGRCDWRKNKKKEKKKFLPSFSSFLPFQVATSNTFSLLYSIVLRHCQTFFFHKLPPLFQFLLSFATICALAAVTVTRRCDG